MKYRILVINPGSTSTKIAVYENENEIFLKTIRHSADDLIPFKKISDQYEFRKRLILTELMNNEIPVDFNAVVGRGGLLKPIKSGTYEVNERLKEDLRKGVQGEHASNLGGLIASEIASGIPGARAFISDPVVVDELSEIARITGLPEAPKRSMFHALNQKAIGRRYAKEHQQRYEDLNLVIAHMGGGISVAAHKKGKVIDVNNAIDGAGPFSPERAGTIPAGELVTLCFSGKYTEGELRKMLNGKGGLMAHVDSNEAHVVAQMANDGDKKADLVLSAMAYNIAKEIGAMSVVLDGKIDAIILTGGIAYNKFVTERIVEKISFLAPVAIYPGEDEMGALAEYALFIMKGAGSCLIYQ